MELYTPRKTERSDFALFRSESVSEVLGVALRGLADGSGGRGCCSCCLALTDGLCEALLERSDVLILVGDAAFSFNGASNRVV